MATASINGIDLHYEIAGQGPPLVWLHGLMGSIARQRQMNEGVEGIEDHGFRAVTCDARGHGESAFTEDEADYSWEAHAADLAALLDHLGIERAVLGGGSMGAGVSITFALAHPERVEKLVLVLPPPLAETIGPARQLFNSFANMIESVGLEKAVEVAMQMPDFADLKESDPEQYEVMREWLLSQRPRAVVPAIRGLLNGPLLQEERFGEIRVPTLIVAHPDDPIHPQSSAERLHAAIAGSTLVLAPQQGYLQEHPGELTRAVVAFLRGEEPRLSSG